MKKQFKLMLGDNIQSLKKLPDNSIDSIVSDPPYGLSFMGKKWDYDVPSVEFWKEVYRVLKPGGHILSFGGTRTYHRMVVNIEDAGFEIRDQVMWLYGSGFPKSHNIGKAVDKIEGNEREVVGEVNSPDFRDMGKKVKDEIGVDKLSFATVNNVDRKLVEITKGQSKYEGWGTALKPANEPICVARKPLSEKTIADNVLKWGTGGINIDGCRIGETGARNNGNTKGTIDSNSIGYFKATEPVDYGMGRFPANIILDETAAELLDEQSGITSVTGKRSEKSIANCIEARKNNKGNSQCDVGGNIKKITEYANDKGGASRFFYVAKVSKKERNMGLDGFEDKKETMFADVDGKKQLGRATLPGNEHQPIDVKPNKNNHPTLKPINLMTYLCRLVTPEGGIVLDPFMGSGSTGIAARLEGFRFVGMEMDPEYFKIAEARIENYEMYRQFLDKKNKK
jgi:site-specific DNA-methyltransferase (adenine-specific)